MSEHKKVTQAVLVDQSVVNTHQTVEELALFNPDGTAFGIVPTQAAAQADVGAVTSVVAAGATPTKAEYDALRVDALANRTVLNALLAKLRTAGVIDT
jgi:hypothetical protein